MGTRLRLFAILVSQLILVACTGGADDRAARDDGTGVKVNITPPGTYSDPLAGLPETMSTARLLVSTSIDNPALLVIDLGTGGVLDITGIPGDGLQRGLLMPDGGAVFVEGPRSIGLVDARGARRNAFAELPVGVPGEIDDISRADDVLVVSTRVADPNQPDRSPSAGRTVLYDLRGGVRCTSPTELRFSWFRAGALWSDDLRSRLYLDDCRTSDGLDLAGNVGSLFFVTSGDAGYISVGGNTISRFDLVTGRSMATSPILGNVVSDVALRGDLRVLAEERRLVPSP